ncbi:HBL/NHE enterotoxin family protein [Bacillus cereus]|uniref:HBL/NHE enterotoxin family protein n=1 Tax=Bacillus cereus TaxID=1396 RepID=UPI000BEBE09D|nr:HBL/NHE enterotoxin family protein [Bacillus cereus]PEF60491.1 hypothetical protein CON35_30605 [Bacillus cereus]
MKKKPWKMLVTSAAVATLLTTGALAPVAHAATNTTTQIVTLSTKQIKIPDKYLGPDGLKKALEDTRSNSVKLDIYATALLKAPDINLPTGIAKAEQIQSMKTDQQLARTNASQWFDTLKPKLIQVSQDIVNFSTKFDKYKETLTTAIDNNNLNTFKQGVNLLAKDVDKYKGDVDSVVTNLTAYRDKLAKDTQNFTTQSNNILALLKGTETGIDTYEKQIQAYQDNIKTATGMIAAGSVSLAWGVGLGILTVVFALTPGVGWGLIGVTGLGAIAAGTTGGVLIAKGNALLQESKQQVVTLTTNLTQAKQNVSLLTSQQKEVTALKEFIDSAVTAAQALSTEWQKLSSKYKNLANTVDGMKGTEELSIFVKADLDTAEENWNAIKIFADDLYGDLKTELK